MAEDEHDYKVGAGTHALQNHQLRETTLLICLQSDAMPVSSVSSQRLKIPLRRLLLRRAKSHIAAGFPVGPPPVILAPTNGAARCKTRGDFGKYHVGIGGLSYIDRMPMPTIFKGLRR